MEILVRKKEQKQLEKLYKSKKPEFLILYGRRRVGKTYLIREYFENKFFFCHTGLEPDSVISQISAFHFSMLSQGIPLPETPDWMNTFGGLRRHIEEAGTTSRKVIFLDEVSWIDADKKGFMSALEFFWNSFGSSRPDVFLIVCGSSTSWILERLLMNKGGFFNRHTAVMMLEPFSLGEVELYLRARGNESVRDTILEYYMIFGGIPYYYDFIDNALGLPSNIDNICFRRGAPLIIEYDRLYATLFGEHQLHHRIIAALSQKSVGLTLQEITAAISQKSGGYVSEALKGLEQCGIIRKYTRYGAIERGSVYQLIDAFTLFYHRFMKDAPQNDEYWEINFNTAKLDSWRGYAFEKIPLTHVQQIKEALRIGAVSTDISSYYAQGLQIDLVLDRKDAIINLCESKYTQDEYAVSKAYFAKLHERTKLFRSYTKTRKTVVSTLITPCGLKENAYMSAFASVVTMDDLFA